MTTKTDRYWELLRRHKLGRGAPLSPEERKEFNRLNRKRTRMMGNRQKGVR